jgi:hypothetical protein
MKYLLVSLFVMIGMSACSAKHNPNGSYERANAASEKAHQGLDKE